MVDVTKKQAARLKFLNAIYDEVDGDPDSYVGSMEIGRKIGITDEREVQTIMHYLADEGLLDIKGFGDDDGAPVGITHQGIIEIERGRVNPQARTEHFPPQVNIINVQNMHGSQIQQGTSSSSQTQINKNVNIETSLRELIAHIENSPQATDDQKELAKTYADVIVMQSKLPVESRSNDIVKKTWEKLSNMSTLLSLADFAVKAAPVVKAFFGF